MVRKPAAPPPIEAKVFQNSVEIDRAIVKLERRAKEIMEIDFAAAENEHTGADDTARSNLQKAILEIYGPNSFEYREHRHIDFWAGPIPELRMLPAIFFLTVTISRRCLRQRKRS
jgi:hypothetical protein